MEILRVGPSLFRLIPQLFSQLFRPVIPQIFRIPPTPGRNRRPQRDASTPHTSRAAPPIRRQAAGRRPRVQHRRIPSPRRRSRAPRRQSAGKQQVADPARGAADPLTQPAANHTPKTSFTDHRSRTPRRRSREQPPIPLCFAVDPLTLQVAVLHYHQSRAPASKHDCFTNPAMDINVGAMHQNRQQDQVIFGSDVHVDICTLTLQKQSLQWGKLSGVHGRISH
uniref:Uncharacterized protein n=1 Tax=Leersia perrieri TaxID=77586 RepID=A0A0D9WXE6_9ORYZ